MLLVERLRSFCTILETSVFCIVYMKGKVIPFISVACFCPNKLTGTELKSSRRLLDPQTFSSMGCTQGNQRAKRCPCHTPCVTAQPVLLGSMWREICSKNCQSHPVGKDRTTDISCVNNFTSFPGAPLTNMV